MRFFKLKEQLLGNHLASKVLYKTNDDLTEQEILILGLKTEQTWSNLEYDSDKLDSTNCIEIDAKEYWNEYDAHIERNSV